jgi:hypothetical protein
MMLTPIQDDGHQTGSGNNFFNGKRLRRDSRGSFYVLIFDNARLRLDNEDTARRWPTTEMAASKTGYGNMF